MYSSGVSVILPTYNRGKIINNLFLKAQEQNVLDSVKQLLLKYIELFNTKGIK